MTDEQIIEAAELLRKIRWAEKFIEEQDEIIAEAARLKSENVAAVAENRQKLAELADR